MCRGAEAYSIQNGASDDCSGKPHRGFRSSVSYGEHLANDGRRHDDQSYGAEPVSEWAFHTPTITSGPIGSRRAWAHGEPAPHGEAAV